MSLMKWIVPPEESGTKLIVFLKARLSLSARHIKRIVEQKRCQVNGGIERFASTPLKQGDRVEFDEEEEEIIEIKDPLARILYLDDFFLFYDKPPGVVSDDPKLLQVLSEIKPHLKLVHRLDKETSGVLLFATSQELFEAMVQLFKEKRVTKEYVALVDGLPSKERGVIENQLGIIRRYEGQTLWGEVRHGLPARTEWQVERKGKGAALLRCFPITGRTHQIRVHLSGIGHPILGDVQYGRHFSTFVHPRRCMLHAEKLSFKHPKTGAILSVVSPLPEDFLNIMQEVC